MELILKKNFYIGRVLSNLTIGFTGNSGRNFYGRITTFHKSTNYSKQKRVIDYKRIFCSEATLLGLEKKPVHTSFIGLLFYFFGVFAYILSSDNMEVGDHYKGFCWNFKKKENFSSFLSEFSRGVWLHHIELKPGSGGLLSRAAGTGSFIYSKTKDSVFLKISSGKIAKLSKFCVGVSGFSSNKQHHLLKKKKAGVNRLLGKRPTVRGVAMNPVDHPHGGGEGKRSKPAMQKTPWGARAKFKKTVSKSKNVKIRL